MGKLVNNPRNPNKRGAPRSCDRGALRGGGILFGKHLSSPFWACLATLRGHLIHKQGVCQNRRHQPPAS